jgi:hypothetical protein
MSSRTGLVSAVATHHQPGRESTKQPRFRKHETKLSSALGCGNRKKKITMKSTLFFTFAVVCLTFVYASEEKLIEHDMDGTLAARKWDALLNPIYLIAFMKTIAHNLTTSFRT